MNDYNTMIQHRQRIADAARHHQEQRHVRDSQRIQEQQAEEHDERPSRLSRILLKAKTVFDALKPANDPVCDDMPLPKMKHV